MEPEARKEEHAVFHIDSQSGSYDDGYEDEESSSNSSEEIHYVVDDEEVAEMKSSRSLKSMGIEMGEMDYDDSPKSSCCSRYWCCWFCGAILAVTLFLLAEGVRTYQKQAALLHGRMYGDYATKECQVYDTQTLQLIEQHMISINDTTAFCAAGKIHECQCRHPYQATKPKQANQWEQINDINKGKVKLPKYMSTDVALIGDSIIEHFNGHDLGYAGGKWKANQKVFDKLFTRQNGGKVDGVALGIGGDRIQNLLYRLQNGEAPAQFHPKVWWILIGTNDLVDHCNADTIAVGNFRIVEEIRKAHPGAMIVLNSILPRSENPNGMGPYSDIIQEANLKMECYANTASNVEFFNATDLFTLHNKGKSFVNPALMKDQVHPNAEGTRIWGEAIANRVVELKSLKQHRDKRKKHKPTHHSGNHLNGGH